MPQASLPIDELLGRITSDLSSYGSVVIEAAPGAGKTTRVAPAILDAGLAETRRILLIQPRRLAARMAAQRISYERGTRLGEETGYQVRFDRKAGKKTRLLVATEGILLRMLQDDPFLEGYGVVVFDEFHERSLDTDLGLAMVARVRESRDDLRVVVMSATLNPEPVCRFLGGAPAVRSAGRNHPLTIQYLDRLDDRSLPEQAVDGVAQVLSEGQRTGDVLVFLPGVGEIQRTRQRLQIESWARSLEIRELYGALSPAAQDAALAASDRRRVVLTTNVAETSITVEGVTHVVDCGRARSLRLSRSLGLDQLELGWISRASADQRAGRAGRTGPGHVLRLWTERQHAELDAETLPQIQSVDLTGTVLQLLAWGESDLERFPWFEPPNLERVEQGKSLLEKLGATRSGRVTQLGEAMAKLPLPPRLGRLVLAAQEHGCLKEGVRIAALLADRRGAAPFSGAKGGSESDLLSWLDHWQEHQTSPHTRKTAQQLLRLLRDSGTAADDEEAEVENDRGEGLLRSILAAYPDRIARRRESDPRRAVVANGRGVELARSSAVDKAKLFVCVELRPRPGRETEVTVASAVEREWLSSALIETLVRTEFSPARQRVETIRSVHYEQLVLEESQLSTECTEKVAEVLAAAASKDLSGALALDTPAVASWLARVRFLVEHRPNLGLPKWTEDDLRALLPSLCAGKKSFRELRAAPLLDFMRGSLSREQQLALEREAPETLQIPSGRSVPLDYQSGGVPILAARIQELFGLAETPRIAGGTVPVLLHLLAPNGRPQQVTNDLASFWDRTYEVVRKDLRARYPKHAWPEDPHQGVAERRPRRRT